MNKTEIEILDDLIRVLSAQDQFNRYIMGILSGMIVARKLLVERDRGCQIPSYDDFVMKYIGGIK